MQFRETIAAYSENHMKHLNIICGQNAEFLNSEASGTYSNDCALTGYGTVRHIPSAPANDSIS
jgi:hypothetical protein